MAERLGRITQDMEGPRGPDVVYGVVVRPEWLASGATIEFALPRNLACAHCNGGGCDACGRAGAVSLRDRGAEAESLRVTLPKGCEFTEAPQSGIIVRVPQRGGPAPEGSELPAGHLLLRVRAGEETTANITLVNAETGEMVARDSIFDKIAGLDDSIYKWPITIAILAIPLVLWALLR